MKKLLLVLFILPFLSNCSDTTTTAFIGKWVGNAQGQIGFLSFDTEGFAAFEINGQLMGGKEFMMKGEKHQITYEIDQTKDPIEVDLILINIASQEQKKLPCIASFKEADLLVFAMAFEGDRPTQFTNENSIQLKRIE